MIGIENLNVLGMMANHQSSFKKRASRQLGGGEPVDWEGADTARMKQEVSTRYVHKWADLGMSYVTETKIHHYGTNRN